MVCLDIGVVKMPNVVSFHWDAPAVLQIYGLKIATPARRFHARSRTEQYSAEARKRELPIRKGT